MATWKYYNPNGRGRRTGDCVVRAICAVTGKTWNEVFWGAAFAAFGLDDMPSSNHAWRFYLKSLGYKRKLAPDTCPDCYTVGDFADDHPRGRFVVGTGTHAVGIVDGIAYDTWNSLSQPVEYFYYKEDEDDAEL